MQGAVVAGGKLPDSFKKLPADDNWKDVKANLPGKRSQRRRSEGLRQPRSRRS